MKEEQKRLGLNIQLFAEDGEGETTPPVTDGDNKPDTPPAKPLTFEEMLNSNEDYKKAYQASVDKRVNDGIETAKSKWEENYKKQLEAEKSEAERLAKLTEEEKMKEALEKRDKRIAELEAKESARTLKDETMKILNEKEIPLSYIDLFDFTNMNAETIKTKVELLSSNLSKDKESWLNSSLKQKAPTQNKDKSDGANKPKTYEDFVKELENK